MKRLFKLVIMLWIFSCGTVVFSQERCDSTQWENVKKVLVKRTDKQELNVTKLRRNAAVYLSLTLVVGILGVATGILQRYETRWAKIGTTTAGAVVSILTIVLNTVFDGDHRAMNRRADQIEIKTADIRLLLEMEFNYESCQDLDQQRDTVLTLLRSIETEDHSSSPLAFGLVSTAYAQERTKSALPEWIGKPPEEVGKIFFVGIGEGKTLREAENSARRDGFDEATTYLTQQFVTRQQTPQSVVDTKSIAEFLIKHAEITQKHFDYNKEYKKYTYYVLLKLDKKLAEANLLVYAAQEELADPKTYTEAIQQTAAPASEYFERRRIAREKLMSDARNKIPQEIYSDFEHGRLLRKTGKLIEAIDVLSQVTRKQSDFYLAWYNLALAYMAANMNEKADAAFTKAIALEPAQPARDASLYNSYGWFLYLGKRYEEAIKAFEQALSIDPAHATAKNNLEAAKKMLR